MRIFTFHLIKLFCICISAIPTMAVRADDARDGHSEIRFLDSNSLPELSGLTQSHADPDIIWAINDSGNPPEIHAIRNQTEVVASLRVNDALNVDWEDIAAFTHEGKKYLLVADTGDNAKIRDQSYLYIVREPVAVERKFPAYADLETILAIQFPDGPSDIEAVAVDAQKDEIYLLTKRPYPPVLYRLPLRMSGSENPLAAERVARLDLFRQAMPQDVSEMLSNLETARTPSGMEISPDGNHLGILTYDCVFLFSKSSEENWGEVLRGPSVVRKFSGLQQAEGICFDADNSRLTISSEGSPAPVLEISLDEFLNDQP